MRTAAIEAKTYGRCAELRASILMYGTDLWQSLQFGSRPKAKGDSPYGNARLVRRIANTRRFGAKDSRAFSHRFVWFLHLKEK